MNQAAATMRRTRRVQPRRRAARLRRVVALRDRVRALIAGSGSSMRDSVVDGKGTGGGDCRATFPQGPKPRATSPSPSEHLLLVSAFYRSLPQTTTHPFPMKL